jgi:hypothetical protein
VQYYNLRKRGRYIKLNDFNNKVNLPKFCSKLGLSDYQFVKLPTFGWFAYNKDKTVIGNIFDIVGQKDRDKLFALITKEKREFLDFEIAYTDIAESAVRQNHLQLQLWTAAYSFAKKEFETYQANFKGKKEKLSNILRELGYSGVLLNNMGIITRTVLERFNMLPWPKIELRGRLIIPTFHTPFHISSLEACPWDNPGDMTTLFLNDEKGWYGSLSHKTIVPSLRDLWHTPGNTWDYKCDYWYDDNVVTLADTLDIGDYIKIWTEAKDTAFNTSPLDRIVELGKTEDLRHYVGQLNYSQLSEIEEKTGEKLSTYWKKAKEVQVQIGKDIFVRRDNCYYAYRKGQLEQISNFAIDVEKIVKRGTEFFRLGIVHIGNKSASFEISEKWFTTNYLFQKGLRQT